MNIELMVSKRQEEKTHSRVEEKGVWTPRERCTSPVEVVVSGSLWEFTTVFVLDVLNMSSMFCFGVVDPCTANSN